MVNCNTNETSCNTQRKKDVCKTVDKTAKSCSCKPASLGTQNACGSVKKRTYSCTCAGLKAQDVYEMIPKTSVASEKPIKPKKDVSKNIPIQVNLRREQDERSEIYKNRVIYSLPVRAGYWSNELAMRDQKEFTYNYKKEHCQLLIQKTRKMFRNLLRPTVLAAESTHVIYNQNYQIKSYGITHVTDCGKEVVQPLYVSGVITEKEIESTQHFTHGCSLTASPSRNPCVRNSFIFVGCGEEKHGAVNYGDDVYIQISESNGPSLYVQCENSTMDTFGRHLSLRLSQVPDIYCRFKIFHWKPSIRQETCGTFVFYNCYVIIQHTASGQNLASDFNRWLPTFFGSECALSCHTYRDSRRMETSENLWKIVGVEKTDLDKVEMLMMTPDKEKC